MFNRPKTNNPQIYVESQITLNSQSNLLKKRTKQEESHCYKAMVIKKKYCTGTKIKHRARGKRKESPEINPCMYGQLINKEAGKNATTGKREFL